MGIKIAAVYAYRCHFGELSARGTARLRVSQGLAVVASISYRCRRINDYTR